MTDKPKHVKVYDLQNNLITEFSTFKEAAQFIGVGVAAIKNSVYRDNNVRKKYKIRSEGPMYIGFKRGVTSGSEYCRLMKRRNNKRCMVKYNDPVLETLSVLMNHKISEHIVNYKNSRNLTDKYIINALSKHVGLKQHQITQQMIDVKRKHIEIIRNLKNQGICVR